MLSSLHIENIAVIERSDIDFGPGLNVLTGETGAGKSIVIDSINAVLGARTSRELVRSGADKSLVSAVFTDERASIWCGENEMDSEEETIVQRRINADGKSSCRINGLPAAAQQALDRQMASYAQGARCLAGRPGLFPALLALCVLQLTALFAVPFVVALAFGLNETPVWVFLGTQALLTLAVSSLPLPGAVGPAEGGFVQVFAPLFGAALVTPAMLVSRGISFYAFLLLSAGVTLLVHLRGRPSSPYNLLPTRPNCGTIEII